MAVQHARYKNFTLYNNLLKMYAFLPHKVCVKECPTQTTSLYAYAVAKAGDLPIDQIPGFPDFDLDFQRSLCVPYLTDAEWEDAISSKNGTKLKALINHKKCPAYTIASIGIAQRCVPDFGLIPDGVENGTTVTDSNKNDIQKGDGTKVDFGDVIDSIKAIIELLNLQTITENILADVVKTKWMLLLGLGISKTFTFPVSHLDVFVFRLRNFLPLDLPNEVHRRCDDLALPRAHHRSLGTQLRLHVDEVQRLEGCTGR